MPVDVVELVVAAVAVHPGGAVGLPDVVDSPREEDRSVDVVVAVVAAVVSLAVADAVVSHPVDEVDTKRIPDRFTFTTKTPGRAVFPCRGMTLDVMDTNRYHEHSTAFGSSMGFLVHVEHGAVLENALEHCTDDSHFKLNRNFKTRKPYTFVVLIRRSEDYTNSNLKLEPAFSLTTHRSVLDGH